MNVLITGANGFIGSNLYNLLSPLESLKLFKGTRATIDLYSLESVKEFVNKNEINAVVHCAIEGGKRNIPDTVDIVYKNLLMFENLTHALPIGSTFINFGSGAEYDRKYPIENKAEEEIFAYVPTDYYGFSKSIISKRLLHQPHSKAITLRIFGCFYHNELPNRFIRSNIERCLKGEPMVIHQNKYMDFFYMEDLANLVGDLLQKCSKYKLNWYEHDINLTYNDPKKLSDIANIINSLSDKKVDVIIENKIMGASYFGESYGLKIKNLYIPFKGLENGIRECYERLK